MSDSIIRDLQQAMFDGARAMRPVELWRFSPEGEAKLLAEQGSFSVITWRAPDRTKRTAFGIPYVVVTDLPPGVDFEASENEERRARRHEAIQRAEAARAALIRDMGLYMRLLRQAYPPHPASLPSNSDGDSLRAGNT